MESGAETAPKSGLNTPVFLYMKSSALLIEHNNEIVSLNLFNSITNDPSGLFHKLNFYEAVSPTRGTIASIAIVQVDKGGEWTPDVSGLVVGESTVLALAAAKAANTQEAELREILGRVIVKDLGFRIHVLVEGSYAGFGITRAYTDAAGVQINPRWGATPIFSWDEACAALGIAADRETVKATLDEIICRAGVRLDTPTFNSISFDTNGIPHPTEQLLAA